MEVSRVLVVGAGTMGHGIAQAAALAGYTARLYDVEPKAVAIGLARAKASLEKGVAAGKTLPADRDAALERLSAASDLKAGAADADLVVEAIPERIDLKRKVFADLGALAPKHAVLATNTSSLSISEIAAASGRPSRVVGMHFFNPVPRMPLLEVVRGAATGKDTVDVAVAVGKRMGKTVIVVSDSPGFATSRLGIALGLEAMRMVEEGVASPEDIDIAMEKGYGHAMGPLRTTDKVGLDVRLEIAKHLDRAFPGGRFAPPKILEKMVAEGRLGEKSGKGFYDWKAPA